MAFPGAVSRSRSTAEPHPGAYPRPQLRRKDWVSLDGEWQFAVSEFGGVSYVPPTEGDSWGYVTASSASEFEVLLRGPFEGVQSSPVLAGFCYTQATDTLQEANGLADARRVLKLPAEVIGPIVRGDGLDTASQRRPRNPVEKPNAALPSSSPS